MNEEQAKAYLKWMAQRKMTSKAGIKFQELLKKNIGDEEE
tara:strand:+ start:264 stop:383 length:120 start_codon:yes stop_codon:yes gene_type:complete